MKKKATILYLLFLISGSFLFAQNSGIGARSAEEMINIPPLKMLIDSAKIHSPLLHTKDIEIAIKNLEYKLLRWEWADYIRPFTEYRYGSIDNYVLVGGNIIGGQQSVAHRFSLGAQVNLTIFDVIKYRKNLKITDKLVELDISRRMEIERLISQEVIRLWNILMTYREIWFIQNKSRETQILNEKEAKLKYRTGEVELVELARISEIATRARADYELARNEFRGALYLLIEIVGKEDITNWI